MGFFDFFNEKKYKNGQLDLVDSYLELENNMRIKELKNDVITDLDDLINKEINKGRSKNTTFRSYSPDIISPSMIGMSEKDRLESVNEQKDEKIRELELEVERLKRDMKLLNKPLETIVVDIEVPKYFLNVSEDHKKLSSQYRGFNSVHHGMPINGLYTDNGFNYQMVNRPIYEMFKISIPGFEELETRRVYSRDIYGKVSLMFGKIDL